MMGIDRCGVGKIESSAMLIKAGLIQSRSGSISMASYQFPWSPYVYCIIGLQQRKGD